MLVLGMVHPPPPLLFLSLLVLGVSAHVSPFPSLHLRSRLAFTCLLLSPPSRALFLPRSKLQKLVAFGYVQRKGNESDVKCSTRLALSGTQTPFWILHLCPRNEVNSPRRLQRRLHAREQEWTFCTSSIMSLLLALCMPRAIFRVRPRPKPSPAPRGRLGLPATN
ncbi:hypothetical protein LZ30DRAFT_237829 [Colletotrichum cereale]|nr:hypothetical protein LZ30DRAFT_237829 [Colletotrichum cereale]